MRYLRIKPRSGGRKGKVMSLTNDEQNSIMREASGSVRSECKLTSFLYELIRDHLPAGTVEGILKRLVNETQPIVYTNGWLAKYAENVAKRLQGEKK